MSNTRQAIRLVACGAFSSLGIGLVGMLAAPIASATPLPLTNADEVSSRPIARDATDGAKKFPSMDAPHVMPVQDTTEVPLVGGLPVADLT